MEEILSWRAKLAKHNINILDIKDGLVFFEFQYHPKPGRVSWCKTVCRAGEEGSIHQALLDMTADLRRELED